MQRHIIQSWWVLAFAIVCFGLYEQSAMKLEREICLLEKEASTLQTKITEASLEQEELTLQVNSQSDPAWIELVLIRGLGLVPEGTTKIYYKLPVTNEPAS